jgi:DivIVA domain-containing protein
MRKKKDGTTAGTGFEAGAVPTGPLTPIDIQQKKFGAARFGGGYRMREVDEFLDQVTDALSALIAENERLRAGGSASVASPPPPPAASVADRAGVDAFLEREKGFLQSLGGLVQEHAEELKEMVRAARREWVAAAAAAPVVPFDEGDVEPPAAIAAPEVTETDGETDAEAGVQEPREAESESDDTPPAADEPPATEDPPETGAGGPQAPIRLEEPEPARARRSEDGTEGSLRELFWGED